MISVKTRKSDDVRNGDRSRSSSVVKPSEVKRSGSVSRSSGPTPYTSSDRHDSGSTAQAGARSSISVSSKPRGPPPQARDARLPRESLAEFAEFIRSTGPNGAAIPSNTVRNAGGPVPISKPSIETARVSTTSNPNRNRLQAREAAVDYKDDNSDLIDFIRRGPPSTGGNPRIPRTVAPFRTTMDSDQLSGAVGGKAVDAQLRDIEVRSSQASTNVTESSMPSGPSSINSQSALLGRNKPLPGGNSRFGGPGDDDMPIPKRKTRRVRDPYAIDLSDEDEDLDEFESTPRPQKRVQTQEESLMDFLRNVPPPPEPVVQPFTTNTQTQNKPKKKSSAPSLMARFTRRDSTRGDGNSSGGSSPRSPVPVVNAVEPRPLNSRASSGKGYIPIQVNMPPGADSYAPTPNFSKATAMMGGGMSSGGGGRRVPMKRFEPREAVSVPSRGTSELAEFFKNSEPPPSVAAPSQFAPPVREDGSGISKVFSRRKKTSVA